MPDEQSMQPMQPMPEATAPSLRAAAPRNRKDQSEEYPMHYIADNLDMDAWVKAGRTRLERLPSLLAALHTALPSRRTLGTRGTREGP